VDDLTSEFIAETRETLEAIAEALVAWEADPSTTERLDEIFRFVHTVKGSCGFLDLVRIEALAHAAETILGELRGGTRIADRRLVGAMLGVIDRIALLVEALDTDAEFPPVEGDQALIAALDAPADAALPVETEAELVAGKGRARNVRVAVELLDAMMSQVSDLVLVRNDLSRKVRTSRGDSATEAALDKLSACVADLRDSVAKARMQPVERLFTALPRLVRDTCATLDKQVELVMTGSDVELDREMVERLRDPLVHIVRNAIDHGIETAAERIRVGKPLHATLKVEAKQSGNQIAIVIIDDGRGIDCDRLRKRAVDAGLLDARAAAALDEAAALSLIFTPGLSTAEAVTTISGRGVGMDVVRANVEGLGGTISLDNRIGEGLTVELRAPLTLSIVSVLSITAGGRNFALPRAAVDQVLAVRHGDVTIEPLGEGQVVRFQDQTLPVILLGTQMGHSQSDPTHLVVIDGGNGARWALATDGIGDHEEVVIRPVAPVVAASGLFAGQALPDDGKPLLILDVLGLARRALVDMAGKIRQAPAAPAPVQRVALVTFRRPGGQLEAIPAHAVERITDLPRTAFTQIGDATIINDAGLVFATAPQSILPEGDMIAVLRLARGSDRVGLAVQAVHDLVHVAPDVLIETPAGIVVLIDGATVPLLVAEALFENPAHRHASVSSAIPVAA
jgi:two-component system, chemotaxis family, sensor kinase CheA